MIIFQRSEVKMATMHRADALSVYCTMFNIYGVPQKQFSAFYAYDALRQEKTEVSVTSLGNTDGVYAMAAGNADSACIGIAQYRGAWKSYDLDMKGLDENATYVVERYLTDDKRSYECISTEEGKPSALSFRQYLKENSVFVMKIRKKS
jgi:hypothetical protein